MVRVGTQNKCIHAIYSKSREPGRLRLLLWRVLFRIWDINGDKSLDLEEIAQVAKHLDCKVTTGDIEAVRHHIGESVSEETFAEFFEIYVTKPTNVKILRSAANVLGSAKEKFQSAIDKVKVASRLRSLSSSGPGPGDWEWEV